MNNGLRNPSYIGAIRYNVYPDIRALGNIAVDTTNQLGIPVYSFSLYDKEDTINDNLILLIDGIQQNNDICFIPTLCIDARVLHDERIISILEKSKLYNLRIMDDNYTLTEEDARIVDRLSITTLSVDNSEVDRNYIIKENNVFKYNHEQNINDVYNPFIDDVYHINHELTDEQYDYLMNNIVYSFPSVIEIDVHDPSKYESILNKIASYPGSEKLTVRFLGYTLDASEDQYFRDLKNVGFKGNIEVLFHTCHDMINQYQEEPICFNRNLYSHIEDGGCESLDNYLDMLNNINEVSTFIKNNNLSPLETAIYVKQYFDNNFIYNPDELTAGQDSDVQIGKIFNTGNTDGKKVAVCLGFASLYSAILRRNGIKCFRYGCTAHSRNIIRITDPKYGIDKIATIDTTFDLPKHGRENLYDNFMLSPYDATSLYTDDFFTIPHFFINQPDDSEIERLSVDKYDRFYHPLGDTSSGYGMRMMELMGLCHDHSTLEEIDDAKIKAFDAGLYDRLDNVTLAEALVNVNAAQGKHYPDQLYIDTIVNRDEVLNSIDNGPVVVVNNDPNIADYYNTPLNAITKEYSDNWKQTHTAPEPATVEVPVEEPEIVPEEPVNTEVEEILEGEVPHDIEENNTPVLVDTSEEELTHEGLDELYDELIEEPTIVQEESISDEQTVVPEDNVTLEPDIVDDIEENEYGPYIETTKNEEKVDDDRFKDEDEYYDYIASRPDLFITNPDRVDYGPRDTVAPRNYKEVKPVMLAENDRNLYRMELPEEVDEDSYEEFYNLIASRPDLFINHPDRIDYGPRDTVAPRRK